jgi:uncharacterized membrane protein YfcA
MDLILTGFGSAFVASLVASFAGGGSSLLLLPFLLFMAPGSYASLLTTTKVSATTMTLVSAFVHSNRHKVEATLLSILIVCGLVGTGIGTYLVQYHPNQGLFELLLAATLLFTASYLLFSKSLGIEHPEKLKLTAVHYLVTALFTLPINILNGIFGGTGILMTLFCVVYLRMTFIRAIAYTMLMYVLINITQTTYLVLTESVLLGLTLSAIGGALIGSWIGTHLQYAKGNVWVKRAAIVMMFVVSVKILLG